MHVAFIIPDLKGGGAQKMMINLANQFASQGHRVDLVLFQRDGLYANHISKEVYIHDLKKSRSALAVFPLRNYIRLHKPDIVMSALFHVNLITILSSLLAKVEKTKIIISERNNLSLRLSEMSLVKEFFFKTLVKILYPFANKIIGISDGVCEDLRNILKPDDKNFVKTIYNPVVTGDFERLIQHNLPSLYPKDTPLRLIASGRFVKQKDYPTMMKALAYYKEHYGDFHLVILGDGPLKNDVIKLARSLNINQHISLIGFVDNPLACLKQADIFILSSAWEGFCNVIVEALYCGLKIVSTDCPSGPAEILEKGKYGRLVPVGEPELLAKAIHIAAESEINPDLQRRRAMDFTAGEITKKFKRVFHGVLND
jgi:glycosyltransferase involved in cell wall biosynthesis